mmetsp:Transcript_14687/g.33752  ORF Transcript_14687/g.33752 Transcript_14687/m.33752 type:complete len:298 (+) Transcript_14687:342-1235(+)
MAAPFAAPSASLLSDRLAQLARDCPESTPTERQRFVAARNGNATLASKQLRAYLDWRTEHLPISPDDEGGGNGIAIGESTTSLEDANPDSIGGYNDDDDNNTTEREWRIAADRALASSSETPSPLAQMARIVSLRDGRCALDRSGRKILQVLPAMVDLSVAPEEAWALALALYLEGRLDKDSAETLVVAVDVRGGKGWANPAPRALLSFVRTVSVVLERNFPERLSRVVLFPVPAAASYLWKVVKLFLDRATAKKIEFVRGDSGSDAALPREDMEDRHGLEKDALERMEELRVASFR